MCYVNSYVNLLSMKLYVIIFSVRRSRQFGAILNRYKMNMFSLFFLFFFFCMQEHLQTIWSNCLTEHQSYNSLHFITNGSYTIGFSTIQTLGDFRRPPKVTKTLICFLRINPITYYLHLNGELRRGRRTEDIIQFVSDEFKGFCLF